MDLFNKKKCKLALKYLFFFCFYLNFAALKYTLMQILTKNTIKEIRALEQRKGRKEQHAWLAEGNRMVGDLLVSDAFACRRLVATCDWWEAHPEFAHIAAECYQVTPTEMQRVSLQQAPQDVLAVFDETRKNNAADANDDLSILLDEVQDPGNLGTIIRTADWFGVRDIFCAPGTADCFNPKVVQATMSALARVRVHYFASKEEECAWLQNRQCPIYGTFLEGDNIYATRLQKHAVLVMGNEGRGVSPELAALVTDKLLIPHFAADGQHVESLNVSVATAICLSEMRRS